MNEYTSRFNINRGYMKLEVWNNSMTILKYCSSIVNEIKNLDYKLKSQILNSAQSISSNIAEGYSRRSINEYVYFLNIALGSTGELFSRKAGLLKMDIITKDKFEEFDIKHYELENKILALVKSLQSKKKENNWEQEIHEPDSVINLFHNSNIPLFHCSINDNLMTTELQ